MQKHEIKITNEIKENKGSKKMWEEINKLKNRNTRTEKDLQLYDDEGRKLDTEEARRSIERYWSGIYQKHRNKVSEVWEEEKDMYMSMNDSKREQVGKAMQEDQLMYTFPVGIREHQHMCYRTEI